MVYGETGRFPLYISLYCRMISHWAKLLSGPSSKIVCTLYKFMFKLYCDGDVRNPWMCCIEKILNTCGLSYIWQNHVSNMNVKWLKCVIKQNLQDQFLQKWYSDMNNSSKGQVYRIFKQNFGMEHYLKTLSPKNKKILVKFRTALQIISYQWKPGDGMESL